MLFHILVKRASWVLVHWFVWPQMSWATYFPIYPARTSSYYFCLGFIFVSDSQKDYVLLGLLLWSFDPTVKLVGFHLWSLIQNMVKLVGPDPDSELTNFHRFPPISRPLIWQFNLVWTTHNTEPESTKVPQTSVWSSFVTSTAVLWLSPWTEDLLHCELLGKNLGAEVTDQLHTLWPCVTERWICKRRNPRSLLQSLNCHKSPFCMILHSCAVKLRASTTEKKNPRTRLSWDDNDKEEEENICQSC